MRARHVIIMVTISVIFYLVGAFISWNILWIRNLPKWDESDRAMAISLYLIINIFIYRFVEDDENSKR